MTGLTSEFSRLGKIEKKVKGKRAEAEKVER
jgi:hypothetical protein